MKRVLDRLMARQNRLMESLGPESSAPPRAAVRVLSPDEVQAHLAKEHTALEAAFEFLAEGNLHAARSLLEPLVPSARDTRTLTTLSRIYSMQGHVDLALDHLVRAEAIDPADPKVIHFMAELFNQLGRRVEELHYRRRAAFTTTDAPAAAFVRLISAVVRNAPANRHPPLAEIRLALARVKAATDLAPALRIEAAQSVFGIPSLTKEALSIHASASPVPDGQRDVLARWCTAQAWCAERSAPLHRISAAGIPGMRPMLVEVSDAIVVPSLQWLPLLDDGRVMLSHVAANVPRTRCRDPRSRLLLSGPRQGLLRLPIEIGRVHEPVLLMGGTGRYYEDLIEYTSSLAIAESLGLGANHKILVNANLAPHQLELFDLLGISAERLLPCDSEAPVRVDNLLMPTRLTTGGRWFDPLLSAWYRQRLGSLMVNDAPRRKLYLARSSTTRRRVENEADVIQALEPLGFECVRPESLSMGEQVALFSQASHIVAPSGGALANMVFAPAGAKITVLLARHLIDGGSDVAFEALAKACGHMAIVESCESSHLPSGVRSADADIFVDCKPLVAALS